MTPVELKFAVHVMRIQSPQRRLDVDWLLRRMTPTVAGWCDRCSIMSLVDEGASGPRVSLG